MGNIFANHPLSGQNARNIACINQNVTEWSNVVFNLTAEDFIPTDPPSTVEPRKFSLLVSVMNIL